MSAEFDLISIGTATQPKVAQSTKRGWRNKKQVDRTTNDVSSFADDVRSTFDDLCDKKDPSVLQFQSAFIERASKPQSRESHPSVGLEGVFADLLWDTPPEEFFSPVDGKVDGQLDPDFVRLVRTLIRELAKTQPHIFADLESQSKKRNKAIRSLLQALFRFYSAHEEGFLT